PPAQDHKVDIVAISGLGGHAFGSFKERGRRAYVAARCTPYHITGEGDTIPIARVMVYGYESSLPQGQSFQNLEDLGTSFHSHLLRLAVAGAFRPIIFIAHSLGGLIVKQTLIYLSKSTREEDKNLIRAVYGIAFFGVRHDGMDISTLRSMVGDGPNRFLLESIGHINSQSSLFSSATSQRRWVGEESLRLSASTRPGCLQRRSRSMASGKWQGRPQCWSPNHPPRIADRGRVVRSTSAPSPARTRK
ncbi:hypothetical protein NKR23_g12464, partial [Pleurostoma richardsiae]